MSVCIESAITCKSCGTWLVLEHVGDIPPEHPELMDWSGMEKP